MVANNLTASKVKKAIIFAAGFGTRMRPLTLTCPKPLLKLNEISMLEHIVIGLIKYGVEDIYINAHYLAEQIEDEVKNFRRKYIGQAKFHYLYEQEILSGGGTVLALKSELDEPFFTINGDIYIFKIEDIFSNMAKKWHQDIDLLVSITEASKEKGYEGKGDFIFQDDDLKFNNEKLDTPYFYTGIQIVNPRMIEYYRPNESVALLFHNNNFKIQADLNNNLTFHIGDPESYHIANQYIKSYLS